MKRKSGWRPIALILLVTIGLVALAPGAVADQAYQTEKLALEPMDDAPLKDGSVVNIHPNGPKVYAKEIYSLKGAEPNAEYQVSLLIHVQDPDCSEAVTATIPTATLATNGAGNGNASATFTPEDVEGLREMTHGVSWAVAATSDGNVRYATGCTSVSLD